MRSAPTGLRRTKGRIGVAVAATVILILANVPSGAALAASAPPAQRAAIAVAGTATPAPETVTPETPAPETPAPETPTPTATPSPEPTAPQESEAPPSPTPTASPTPSPSEPGDETEIEAEQRSIEALAAPLLDPTRITLPASPLAPAMPTETRLVTGSIFDRSVAASRASYPGGARTVLVASAFTFWDAVTAAGLAGGLRAPTLLVGPTSVPAAVLAELQRLAPTTIAIIGSPGTVSEAVAAQLRTVTPDVRRVDAGSDFGTSRLAMTMLPYDVGTVYLAGSGFASGQASLVDIPVAAATAAGTGGGALLVNGIAPAADADTIAAIRRMGATSVIIIGTTDTVTPAYEQSLAAAGFAVRRSGALDTTERSMQAAGLRTAATQRLVVAHAAVMADIIVAATVAGALSQPLSYAYYACVPDVASAFARNQGARIIAVGDTSWLAPPVESNGSCSTEKPKRDALLTGAIQSVANAYGGYYYVTVRELSGAREVYNLHGGARVEPASMMKLYAAWAALAHVDVGLASYYTLLPGGLYLIDCVAVMIHASDNECHTDILRWIGTPGVNGMIANAGFSGTSYGPTAAQSVLYAGNLTTTDDLTMMVQRLRDGSLLSRANSDLLLSLMGAQIWKSRIASGIPWGVGQQTKPGALWINGRLLQADTGIIHGSRSVVALSIVAVGGVDTAALRAITRIVYSHYNGGFGEAASYPVQQMVTRGPTHIRSGPAGPVIGVIPGGLFVEVTAANRMWYQIRHGSSLVWVDFRALRDR